MTYEIKVNIFYKYLLIQALVAGFEAMHTTTLKPTKKSCKDSWVRCG